MLLQYKDLLVPDILVLHIGEKDLEENATADVASNVSSYNRASE